MDSHQLSTQTVPDSSVSSVYYPLSFSGTGDEYFRIWIVNILLSVLTLSIYSAWAKVRKQQYFLRNTQLAGFAFDYHGTPKAILIGRLIVFGVFSLLHIAGALHPLVSLLIFPALFVLPWILVRSLRFRARNISYRGLRFNFKGRTKQAMILALKYGLVTLLPGGIAVLLLVGWLFPMASTIDPQLLIVYIVSIVFLSVLFSALCLPKLHHNLKHFVLDNAGYGTTPFRFTANARMFYGMYGRIVLTMLGLAIGLAVALVLLGFIPLLGLLVGVVLSLFAPLLYLFAGALYQALIQNLTWNHLQLGEHRFESTTMPMAWFKFLLPNVVLLVLSAGLYYPFFAVKMWSFRLRSIQMIAVGDLDRFIGERVQDNNALGEEVADWFDFDIAV